MRRNLLYGQQRGPPDARVIDFNRAVQILELDGLLERLPHTLSGGERQRVALGRTLLCGPELLLLDEPLAALDVPLKERILDCVEEVLKEWRVPTIYVTHDIGEASRLGEYLVIIEKGQVIHAGATNASMK